MTKECPRIFVCFVSFVDERPSDRMLERVTRAGAQAAGILLQIELGHVDAVTRHQAPVVVRAGHSLAIPLERAAQSASRLADRNQ